MAALMLAVYGGKDRLSGFIFWATAGGMAILGLMIAFAPAGPTTALNGSFVNDEFARYTKVVMLFGSAAMLLLSQDYLIKNKLFKFEFPILIALATMGMMLMASSGDLMPPYM